jgi:hypothetical protein
MEFYVICIKVLCLFKLLQLKPRNVEYSELIIYIYFLLQYINKAWIRQIVPVDVVKVRKGSRCIAHAFLKGALGIVE